MASSEHALSELNTFDQILLLAFDLEALASASSRYFKHIGAKQFSLVWITVDQDPLHIQTEPKTQLNAQQAQLIQQAYQQKTDAKIISAHHTHKATILTAGENYCFFMLYSFDENADDPQLSQLWLDAQQKLAWSCEAVMQLLHLRSDYERLTKAENLQQALFAISDLANSDKESQVVLQEIHQIVGTLMYADNFLIVRYDHKDESMRFI